VKPTDPAPIRAIFGIVILLFHLQVLSVRLSYIVYLWRLQSAYPHPVLLQEGKLVVNGMMQFAVTPRLGYLSADCSCGPKYSFWGQGTKQ